MNLEEEIARTIGENFEACRGRNGVSRTDLAAALMPLVKRAQAEALREAAADYGPGQITGLFTGRDQYPREWMLQRAARIESEVPGV
ncbi:hypothetical protein PQI51_03285 [Microbacterium esteraromaticum]|uniref:hypothetical protein n=1 Tax=Microbacterium esteraromaticum TaxID=57043 RepID=UPI00309F7C99